MTPTNYTDDEKSVIITSTVPISLENAYWLAANAAMTLLNSVAPIATITIASNTTSTTFKDARTFTVAMDVSNPTNPTFSVNSGSSFFASAEFEMLQNLGLAFNTMIMMCQVSSGSITYA